MELTIAILAGDGIGPEVMQQALIVLDKVAEKFHHKFTYKEALVGGAAFDKYETHLPEETIQICETANAILFGSVGGPLDQMHLPKWKNCEINSILGLRKAFQFNANFRPARVYPELSHICPLKPEIVKDGVDILIIRELVSGIYFGKHTTKMISIKRYASDLMQYHEDEIASIAHTAFQAAQKRHKKVTSVDKSNVLDCSKLWKDVVTEISENYPDVTLEHMFVDNCAMQIIKRPSDFDVILTENMFGDILSDEASVLPGSLGLMPTASLNEQGFGLYEPAGGSAPDLAGKNIANPIAQILSAALMLRHSFNLIKEAEVIELAVQKTIAEGYGTADICLDKNKTLSTEKLAEKIVNHI